jgi:FdhD protein
MASSSVRAASVTRMGPGGETQADDRVVVEEPLEIRVAGEALAVTMRTPGHDRELSLGFLWAEGVISSIDDVSSVTHCGRTGDESRENVIDVTPAPGARLKLPDDGASRRGTLMSSACGVCGRKSIDDLLARCRPVTSSITLSRAVLCRAMASLRDAQPVFAETGGCHGAALIDADGTMVLAREDVGRHNAVDKLVGARLLSGGLPCPELALIVSGRTSFEIVQKAVAAGVSIVASVSAPSSLAIDVATRAGVTLVGFVRGDDLVVYSGATVAG